MKQTHKNWFGKAVLLGLTFFSISSFAQAPHRVASQYEDTVRIAVIWNNPTGNSCSNASLHQPVGEKTRNFVLKALDTTQVNNIKVLINTTSTQVTWANIQSLWGASKLPHVIVHVNAGWSTGWNTSTLQNTFTQAVNNHIGIVSVGDDAASLATQTFGFTSVENVPAPLGDGTSIDSLWIGLIRANDNKLKVYNSSGALEYPGVNGIISNAIDSILKSRSIVQFKPLNNGRCQADADRYAILYPKWLTMLGYQQGYLDNKVQPDRSNDLNVLVALQDTTAALVIRRGVSVSFQPQFLQDSIAIQQIIYDAVMFASLAHTLSVPTTLIIRTDDDTITAGSIDSLHAYIIDQKGDTIVDPTVTVNIKWQILTPLSGDQFIGNNYGPTVAYTATQAYRTIRIMATFATSSGTITDTAIIYVRPGLANHLVVEGTSTPPLFGDNPIGGNSTVSIGAAQTSARGYAVLRDRYTNFVSFSTSTKWDTLAPTGLVTAVSGQLATGEGVITKLGNPGTTWVRATDNSTNFSDTVRVIVENTTYDSLRIMQFDVTQGKLVTITSLSMRTSDTTTLYVQGLRTDRLGPSGSNGWVDVSGNWSISATLRTNPTPPSSQYNWRFTPVDTGHGTITVSINTGSPSKTIPAEFIAGTPTRLVLYPISGNPGTTAAHREPPLIADTVSAGAIYSKLYAKLFDDKSNWLSNYETNYTLSQQISWSVQPIDETTLSALSGYSTTITSTRAYRAIRVKATLGTLTDSVLLFIKPDTANHLVIEAQAGIQDSINDDPLSALVIRSDQTLGYVYAILRDRFGNFVNYSQATKWLSFDTSIFKADTGIKAIGEGLATRVATQGISKMVAIDTIKNMQDTVSVEVQNITYSALRMYILDNGPKYVDSIVVYADIPQTLFVEGKRSDNQMWELIPSTWTKSTTLKTLISLPSTPADRWTVTPNPDSLGSGWIKVSRDGATPDSVWATIVPGLPGRIAIYKEAGTPFAQVPYEIDPQVNNIIAGTTAPLYAKIFDSHSNWLSLYENNAVSKNLITWSITKTQGTAPAETLSTRNGYISSFTPTAAYTNYIISVQYNDGVAIPITAQITVTVQPGPADHLVIEGTPNITGTALNSDQPLAQIEFGSKDTIKTAYAILRDRFGNLAQTPYSTSTLWSSFDTTVVSAQEGVALVGEGQVTRIGILGQTKVVAINRQNPLLKDTVDAVLKDFSYDSLRIVIDESTRIESLTMRSDQDTILRVQGLVSFNNTWVAVEGNWLYSTGTTSLTQSNSSFWNFTPGDTGTGVIIVSLGNAVPDTITVKILPGLPVKLALYAKEGPVPDFANPQYSNPTDTLYDTAGNTFPLVAKIFDHKNVWLSEFELQQSRSNLISWTVQEMPGFTATGTLNDTIGHKTGFLGINAYQTVYIIATFQEGLKTFSDTVLLNVVPGKATQVVIEGSPDWKSSPNDPNPVDTVQITSQDTSALVYAILRDSLGNFVNYANVKDWGVVNNDTIISITKGNINLGEGFIQRLLSTGTARINVLDVNGLVDTSVVQLLPYYYTELQILINNIAVDSLVMNTNQDTTLHVQGRRSDNGQWEDVSVKWENTATLKTQPPAPGKADTWRFSPVDTGSGWIRVTMDNDLITKPDTIKVRFEIGPPIRATIVIVTPEEQRIAGNTLKTVVTLYNQDGKVPGEYCFDENDVKYSDILDASGRPLPYVILNGTDIVYLNSATNECFTNGVDTLEITLFYVPNTTDSLHQITVTLGTIKATTTPFVLLPAELSTIVLEKDGQAIKDTLRLTWLDKNIVITAIGYDKYGNLRGEEKSNWTIDSILPQVTQPNNVVRIIYDATSTTDNKTGTITAISVVNSTIKGSTVVKITAPLATITSAITRDNNGNGLLDGLDITFSKSVTFPPDFVFTNIRIRYDDDTYFVVDSIYSVNGTQTDSAWHFVLKEIVTTDPQTSWIPTISFNKIDSLQIEAATNVVATDGAGPVVWKVTKTITNLEDRTQDLITVVFSEPVVREIDGSNLNPADPPASIFYVWELNANGELIRLDSALIGINGIKSFDGTTLTFITSNGSDISSKNYISLNDSLPYIKDVNGGSGNTPVPDNIKINVLILNTLPPVVKSVPNPSCPTFARVQPGELYISHEPDARSWVKNDKAGTIISFPIAIPDRDDNIRIKCKMKIHDIAGNMVTAKDQPDLLKTIPQAVLTSYATTYDVDIYWNGSNINGMKVAPGIYRVDITLEYSGTSPNMSKYKNSRIIGTIGIAR